MDIQCQHIRTYTVHVTCAHTCMGMYIQTVIKAHAHICIVYTHTEKHTKTDILYKHAQMYTL